MSRLKIDALILAANEIVVDVRPTYHNVVCETVQRYLEEAISLSPSSKSLITADEVHLLQKKGEFTNYWDLTTAFLMYFTGLLPPVSVATFPGKFHIPGLMAYLQLAGGNLDISVDQLREQKDIAKLADDIAAAGGGLSGGHKVIRRENRHLLVCEGDILKTNIAARLFQEVYLGAELFEELYDQPAFVVQSDGYIGQESLVIDDSVLADVSQALPVGIVSDRPKYEVERFLTTHRIDHCFQTVIALEDLQLAKANPVPDPWPLLEAARQLLPSSGQGAYIGANVGDVQAATAANEHMSFAAIGCLVNAPDKEGLRQALEQNEAAVILDHPNHLKELILG